MSDEKPTVAIEYNFFADILGGAGRFVGKLCDGVSARFVQLEADRSALLAAIDDALAHPGAEWPRILREAAEKVRNQQHQPQSKGV